MENKCYEAIGMAYKMHLNYDKFIEHLSSNKNVPMYNVDYESLKSLGCKYLGNIEIINK